MDKLGYPHNIIQICSFFNIQRQTGPKLDNFFTTEGEIDILKHYKMNSSFTSIAKLCEKLHKGEDGVSKTWSDVGLEVTGKYTESCR